MILTRKQLLGLPIAAAVPANYETQEPRKIPVFELGKTTPTYSTFCGADVKLSLLYNGIKVPLKCAQGITYEKIKVGTNVQLNVTLVLTELDDPPSILRIDNVFTIEVFMENELGRSCLWTIVNAKLIGEGGGITIDDLSHETVYTFKADDITKKYKNIK